MRKTILITVGAIWTLIWIVFGVFAVSELGDWNELSHHLRIRLVMFCFFVPLAWIVGLGKVILLFSKD